MGNLQSAWYSINHRFPFTVYTIQVMADHGPVISIKLNPSNLVLSVQRSKTQVRLPSSVFLSFPFWPALPITRAKLANLIWLIVMYDLVFQLWMTVSGWLPQCFVPRHWVQPGSKSKRLQHPRFSLDFANRDCLRDRLGGWAIFSDCGEETCEVP